MEGFFCCVFFDCQIKSEQGVAYIYALAVIVMRFKLFLILFLFLVSCTQTNEQLVIEGVESAKTGEYKKAITLFTKAINKNPRLQSAYFNRGQCYQGLKEYTKAYHDFDKAMELQTDGDFVIKMNPNSPGANEEDRNQVDYDDALFERAVVKYHMDSIKSAYEDFKRLVEINYRQKAFCLMYQGQILLKAGDEQNACLMMKQARTVSNTEEENIEADNMIKAHCR